MIRSMLLLSTTFLVATGAANAQTQPDQTVQTKENSTEIVVTGQLEESTATKRDSAVVLDARSGQEIRSLPDVNAAEALQRIPGVQLESDSGEGRFVNIRGLDADLNAATYDGVRLTSSNPASPQGGGRAIAFDAFPASVLGGIEVIKSLQPDMDAEGLGGVVNILPRTMAPGQKILLDASAGVGYEPLRGTPRYQGSVTAGVTVDDGKLSLLGTYGYSEDMRGIDDVEADYINDPNATPAGTDSYIAGKAYDDVQPRLYTYHRTRQGFAGSLSYRPDDNTEFYVRGIHAGYNETANKHEFVVGGLGDTTTDANGNIVSRNVTSVDNMTGDVSVTGASARQVAISTREEVSNDLIEAGGKTQFSNGIKIDFRGAYTIGRDRFPYSYFYSFTDPNPISVVYNNTVNPSIPTYRPTDGTDLTDPTLYTAFSGNNRPSQRSDRETSGIINVAIPLGLGEDGEIKVGGGARTRKLKTHSYSANFIDPGQNYPAFSGGGNEVFYNGAYNIGPIPAYSRIEGISQTPVAEDITAQENDQENIYAGYGQYSGTFGRLSVVAGVRFEATDATYRANTASTLADGTDTITPTTAKQSYTNFFPDIDLKYNLSDKLVVHGAFSSAIGRPGFNQISAARSIDVANQVVNQGNPALKPTTGKNFDLSAEYYTAQGGLLSAAIFYKAFSDYIIPTVQMVGSYPDPLLANPAGQIEVDGYQNIGSAHAYGLELDLRQQLTFLPGALSGFGVEANGTIVDSRGAIRQGEQHRLPQTSPYAFNASLFYARRGFQAKVAGAYVSKNIFSVGGSDATDIYSQARFRLDASASVDITPRMSFFVEARNLSNTKLVFTQSSDKNYPIQREFYKPDYLAGVRIRLGG